MATIYYVVTFAGHGDPKNAGIRNPAGFAKLAPLIAAGSGNVTRFAFMAGVGKISSQTVARNVLTIAQQYFATEYRGKAFSDVRFLVYGSSSGGITALTFAGLVPDTQIGYIGLADAAFHRGETDFFMKAPGSRAFFKNENFWQGYQNFPSEPEIHGEVSGFNNIDLTNRLTSMQVKADPHVAAIELAGPTIKASMIELIRSDRDK
jgi:hypothetical protein